METLSLKYKNDDSAAPDGVGLLISILLRYPEVGSISYRQDQHALKFTFMLAGEGDGSAVQDSLPLALEVFHQLEGRRMRACSVEFKAEEQVSVLTITRDVDSLTQQELGLIVEWVRVKFSERLICDQAFTPDEDQLFHEEVIGHMLATIRVSDLDKNIVAVREEGRVLVFRN